MTSLGHAHPVVAEAIAAQAGTLSHVSNLYGNESAPEVAATLDRLIGGGTERAGGQVFFCNSGAEANECALKLARARRADDRYVVVSTDGSFHGRTLATLAATGQPAKHAPFAPDARRLPPRPLRRPRRPRPRARRPRAVAAVLVEPIQGEGGVIVPVVGLPGRRAPALHATAARS